VDLKNIIKVKNLSWLYVFFMMASCSTQVAKPPTSWAKPKPVREESCPDISGVYRNQGIDAPDNKDNDIHKKYPQYLSDFLVSGNLVNGRKHKWITHVELVGVKQGQLVAIIKKQDKTIYTETLVQGQNFICTPNCIEITIRSYTQVYDTGGAGKRTNIVVLNKSNDDSLLVREDENENGLAVLILIPIPFATSATQYYRFPPMDELL